MVRQGVNEEQRVKHRDVGGLGKGVASDVEVDLFF